MTKKLIKYLAIIFCIFIQINFCNAQINPESKRANHWYFGNKAGLDFTSGNPFILGSNSNDPIGFETNGVQRMILDNGGGGQAGGRLALGNNLPAGFAPVARLLINIKTHTQNFYYKLLKN